MLAFKDEMRAFKDEMLAFREEARDERREMNKRWGDLAASLGILVEDIVAPSVPCVLREVFGCAADAVEFSAVRLKRKHPASPERNREFDALAAGCGYVLIVESKTKPDIAAVNECADRLPEAKEYFPEFAARFSLRRRDRRAVRGLERGGIRREAWADHAGDGRRLDDRVEHPRLCAENGLSVLGAGLLPIP